METRTGQKQDRRVVWLSDATWTLDCHAESLREQGIKVELTADVKEVLAVIEGRKRPPSLFIISSIIDPGEFNAISPRPPGAFAGIDFAAYVAAALPTQLILLTYHSLFIEVGKTDVFITDDKTRFVTGLFQLVPDDFAMFVVKKIFSTP